MKALWLLSEIRLLAHHGAFYIDRMFDREGAKANADKITALETEFTSVLDQMTQEEIEAFSYRIRCFIDAPYNSFISNYVTKRFV